MDRRSDPVGQAGRLLKPRSRRRANVQLDLAGIHGREEILAERGRKGERGEAEAQESRDQLDAVLQRELQQAQIAPAEVFELALKAALETHERVAAGFCRAAIVGRFVQVLVAQQIVCQRRHQRA